MISSHKFEAINRSKALYSVCNVEYYQIFVLIDPGKLLCYNVGNKSSLSIVLGMNISISTSLKILPSRHMVWNMFMIDSICQVKSHTCHISRQVCKETEMPIKPNFGNIAKNSSFCMLHVVSEIVSWCPDHSIICTCNYGRLSGLGNHDT